MNLIAIGGLVLGLPGATALHLGDGRGAGDHDPWPLERHRQRADIIRIPRQVGIEMGLQR